MYLEHCYIIHKNAGQSASDVQDCTMHVTENMDVEVGKYAISHVKI
jgi:hypothetical protein